MPGDKHNQGDKLSKPLTALDQEEEPYVIHTTRHLDAKMVSVQEPRTTQLARNNPDITLMASDLEYISRNSTSSLFPSVDAISGPTRQDVQVDIETIAQALDFEDEGHPSLPVHVKDPTPTPPRPLPKLFNRPKLFKTMQQMAQEEAARIYRSGVREAVQNEAGKALSDTFCLGFKSANRWLNTDSMILLFATRSGRKGTNWCLGRSV